MPDQPDQTRRTMHRIPKPLLTRLETAINALADNPRPPGCLKLTGYDNLWRISP